jgi:hypothetical protein
MCRQTAHLRSLARSPTHQYPKIEVAPRGEQSSKHQSHFPDSIIPLRRADCSCFWGRRGVMRAQPAFTPAMHHRPPPSPLPLPLNHLVSSPEGVRQLMGHEKLVLSSNGSASCLGENKCRSAPSAGVFQDTCLRVRKKPCLETEACRKLAPAPPLFKPSGLRRAALHAISVHSSLAIGL